MPALARALPYSTILAAIIAAVAILQPSLAGAADAHGKSESASSLAESALQRRAVEAVIWGMPAVNYDLMLQEMLGKTDGRVGQVIYWGRPLDSRNQTLTPNPDALYFMTFFNTKDGPIVLDLPPGDASGSFNGNIVTVWQMPLEDAGLLGHDKGAGGKYLVLPPGYVGSAPAGYIPLQSDTYGGYALIRSNLVSHSDADVAEVHRLRQAGQGLPAARRRQPARDGFHRREGHHVRLHHSLRRGLLSESRPHRAERALAAARSRHDRPAQVARHREGQAVRS